MEKYTYQELIDRGISPQQASQIMVSQNPTTAIDFSSTKLPETTSAFNYGQFQFDASNGGYTSIGDTISDIRSEADSYSNAQGQTPSVFNQDGTANFGNPDLSSYGLNDRYQLAKISNLENQGEYYDAKLKELQAGPGLMDYAPVVFDGLGAVSSVASYFDNRDLRKKQLEGLDTNIRIAQNEEKYRNKHRAGVQSAFASKNSVG